jgi:hypothetical protein
MRKAEVWEIMVMLWVVTVALVSDGSLIVLKRTKIKKESILSILYGYVNKLMRIISTGVLLAARLQTRKSLRSNNFFSFIYLQPNQTNVLKLWNIPRDRWRNRNHDMYNLCVNMAFIHAPRSMWWMGVSCLENLNPFHRTCMVAPSRKSTNSSTKK